MHCHRTNGMMTHFMGGAHVHTHCNLEGNICLNLLRYSNNELSQSIKAFTMYPSRKTWALQPQASDRRKSFSYISHCNPSLSLTVQIMLLYDASLHLKSMAFPAVTVLFFLGICRAGQDLGLPSSQSKAIFVSRGTPQTNTRWGNFSQGL